MPTSRQFQIDPVQPFLNGHGFNITDQHHRPLFSIMYRTAAEADAARNAVTAALADAIEVTSHA
jgi:hypothetical protein